MPTGAELIAAERLRQVMLGWTAENDDAHDDASLLQCSLYVAGDVLDDYGEVENGEEWPISRAAHVQLKYGKD